MSPVVFSDTIAPTATSASYRLGLVLVGIAMILVPLLYVSLIGVVAWFLVWHVTANTGILAASGGQLRLLAYLTPAVMGGTLLFFMVKPILARRVRRGEPLQVSEGDQPLLHALIREICRQVRAPRPVRVQVDCQVNASASLRGGILGVFRRDLELTIGLPLVTGLSVRELSGVLAHEFGHFAQGGGMRMTALIRSINAWLFRVVHERDSWDRRLEEWSRDGDWRVVIPMALASLSVWMSRRALAAVTLIGHGISCFMLRQMEFDADSYEVKIAGSGAFARTVVRLRELSAGSHVAYGQVRNSLEHRALPADLPRLFAEHSRRLPDGLREQVQAVPERRTGTFDTHPSDGDRVAAAQALAAAGVLVGGDEPATMMFRDFDQLSAVATRHHYEHDLGITLDDVRFISVDETLLEAADRQRTEAAVRAFFGGRFSITRPLRIPVEEIETIGLGDFDRALKEAGAAVNTSSVSADSYRRFEHHCVRRDLAFCAEQLFLAGMPTVDAERFSLAEPTLAGAQSTQRWAMEAQAALSADLDVFDALIARRLALGVLRLDHHNRAGDMRALAVAQNALAEGVAVGVDARRSALAIAFLEEATPVLGDSPHLRQRVAGLAAAVESCRSRALDVFTKAPIPTSELNGAWQRLLSIAPQLPPTEFLDGLLELYWEHLSRITRRVGELEGLVPPAA